MIEHTPNPLSGLSPDQVTADVVDPMSDEELFTAAASLIAVPRLADPDSFALHAPLEVMARAILLSRVSPARRSAARQRIGWIAATWANRPDPDSSLRARGGFTPEDIAAALPLLGGAGHAAIYFHLSDRFDTLGSRPVDMSGTLRMDLARHPDRRVRWIDEPRPTPFSGGPSGHELQRRLLGPTLDSKPDSNFIHPTVAAVDESGAARSQLGPTTGQLGLEEARKVLLRVAAMSMLQDDPAEAPYGWSHCLTLPQAILAAASKTHDHQISIDLAATYVMAFRATQSSGPIDMDWEPDASSATTGPEAAAATAWHAHPEERITIVQDLVDYACPHEDAHLAKYTLACLDAAEADPDAAPMFIAAAVHLAAWWHHHDDPTSASRVA